MEGTWKLFEGQGDRGRIELVFRHGVEFMGRSPRLYAFYGDELIFYCVSGKWLRSTPWRTPTFANLQRISVPTATATSGDRKE